MKYIPNQVVQTFSEIDFSTLYASGKRIIISDLDNTILRYQDKVPSDEIIKLIKELKIMGFSFYLISNNNDKRLKAIVNIINGDGYLEKAGKPKTKRMKKYLASNQLDKKLIIGIGDQLVTDILGFNRLGVYSILVKTMDTKTQKWYTKINRLREKRIIKKIKIENQEIGSKIEKL